MNVDELLTEAAPHHDRLRARTDGLRADVLARATAQPRRHVRRPLRVGLAAAVVATVGVGGVAYATGGIPDLVAQAVDGFAEDAGVAPADRPHPTQVVDLELPDGSRFAAWKASSEAMECTVYTDNWDGSQITGSGGSGCTDGARADEQMIAWAENAARTTFYAVLFGDAGNAAAVRVTGRFAGTGERVDLTAPVDPATHVYAAALPGTNDSPWAYHDDGVTGFRDSDDVSLEFLDARGHVLRVEKAPPS